MKFAAIDFETADSGADSACAIGVVRVEDGVIVSKTMRLIRPPRSFFQFSYIHGITWDRVAKEAEFASVWNDLQKEVQDVDFFTAHNASFDKRVMTACCARSGITLPEREWLCTVQLARRAWDIRPTKLPDVARHLGLKLDHHEALSDSLACAHIVIAALKDGIPLWKSPRSAKSSPARAQ